MISTLLCDKNKKKDPCDGYIVMAHCPRCGKTYRRCIKHGGLSGARRSLRSHQTLDMCR